jgi:hypothetical protein
VGDVNDRIQRRRGGALGIVTVAVVTAAAVVLLPELAGPLFSDGFEGQGQAGAPIDPCADPLVAPAGWDLKLKPWNVAFSGPTGTPKATYPNSVGNPVPLPGWEFYPSTKYRKGQIVAIPFTAKPDQTVDLTWDPAQSQYGYTQPRPAVSMFIGISRCRWDLRLVPGCSMVAGDGSLFYTTRRPAGPACALEPGPYFLNVAMADPTNGPPAPNSHTCSDSAVNSAEGCDVQIRATGY